MKIKIMLLAFSILFVPACISTLTISNTSGLSQEEIDQIPKGASKVIVKMHGVTPDALYNDIYAALIKRGHRVMKSDKEHHYITTEGKDIGESTMQRMTIVITNESDYCQAIITSEWKAGSQSATTASMIAGMPITNEWGRVVFEVNRMGIAFAECVAVAREIPGAIISYD